MNLTTLGMAHMPPVSGLSQAPVPRLASTMRRPVLRQQVRPTEHPDPAVRQRVGALIALFAASLVNVDYASRQLAERGVFRHDTRQALNLLTQHGDKLLSKALAAFDCQDADAVNALSDVASQALELLFQLRPNQIEAALKHMNNMAQSNLTYLPATTL